MADGWGLTREATRTAAWAGTAAGGPQAGPNAGEDRRAVRGAFFGFDDLNGVAIDVGLDLAPQGGARATAAEANVRNGHIHFAEEGEGVAETEGDPFENGANDMSASV